MNQNMLIRHQLSQNKSCIKHIFIEWEECLHIEMYM